MFKSNHFLAASSENGNLDFFVFFLIMMLFFFICAAVIEKYKPQYGHETCYTILFGVSLSLILYVSIGTEAASSFKFNSNFFFNFFLPPNKRTLANRTNIINRYYSRSTEISFYEYRTDRV